MKKEIEEIKITKLKYPYTIRDNIGMYLGDTNDYSTPLREVINNSVDELINNHCDMCRIVNNDKYKIVIDNSRGIPLYLDPDDTSKTITHALITESHVGSKFDNRDEKTGGIHGIGTKAVNAVSDRYVVMVNLNKKNLSTTLKSIKTSSEDFPNPVYVLEYRKGFFESEGVIDESEIEKYLGVNFDFPDDFGTIVFMVPDKTIYKKSVSDVSTLPLKLAKLENEDSSIFVVEDGKDEVEIAEFDYDTDILEGEGKVSDKHFSINFLYEKTEFTVYFSWSDDKFDYQHHGVINLIETPNGGFIEKIVSKSVGAALNEFNNLVKPSDAKFGLRFFSIVFSNEKMKFSSQTKEKLTRLENLKEKDIVLGLSDTILKKVIRKDKEFFNALSSRIIEYKTQINKISNTDFVRSKIKFGDEQEKGGRVGIASKIYEATSKNWGLRTLYITEGNSASGGIIKYRDTNFHSVLPLKGKLLNTSSMDVSDILYNSEVLAIINTIGCGIGDLTDISKSRYGRIILSVDSDSDGGHIANLILSLFLKHVPQIVAAGMIYKLVAPFYVVEESKKKKGYYYLDEKEKVDFSKPIQKRKGLGSYTPTEIKEFLVGSNVRLEKILYDDTKDLPEESKLLYSSGARKSLMIKEGIIND